MKVMTKQHINFIKFSKLYNWSVQYLLDDEFSYNKDFPLVSIGKFLSRNKTPVLVQNDKEYKRVTIKTNNGGVLLRDIAKGDKIGTKKQFVIEEGQFIVSKIDARNGAFGVVTTEVDGAIITGNFWTFDVDYNLINPHYLSLITTTPEFIRFCEKSSTGTTNRHYLQQDLFLEVQIPLPPLNEADAKAQGLSTDITQEKLVADYNKKIEAAAQAQQNVKAKEAEIEAYLYEQLGIEKTEKKATKKGLHFVRFKDLDRWDTLFLQGQSYMLESNHSLVKFSDIITKFNIDDKNNSLRFETFKMPNSEFLYLGMENVNRDSGTLVDLPTINGSMVKSQTIKVPKGYIIYGKLRPYLNKYWLNNTNHENIVCSSEFFVFDIENKKINKSFFKEILASSIIQEQIKDKFSGVRMPRISSSDFYNLYFPLPKNINTQLEISQNINTIREQINSLNKQSQTLKQQAIKDFENTIFKTESE